jgi:hypothetical protein
VLRGDPSGYGYWVAVTLLTGASVFAVGAVTENRRYGLTRWLRARLSALVGSAAAQSQGQPEYSRGSVQPQEQGVGSGARD